MTSDPFESLGRSLVERNRQARADFSEKSAQLVAALMSDTMNALGEFNEQLARELHELLPGQGEDTTTSGASSGAGSTTESSGEPTQQRSGVGGGEAETVG